MKHCRKSWTTSASRKPNAPSATTLQHAEGLRSGREKLELADEIGDLLFTLAAFANANGLRLGDCVNGVLEKYQTRDSTEW